MLDRSTPPPAGAAPRIPALRPERHQLPGGLHLAWIPRPALPEAALRLVIPAGADSHGPDSAGLASLVGSLLLEGAAGRTSRDMADWIDGFGAGVSIAVRYDAVVVRVHTLAEHLAGILDVLAAITLRPDFPEHEVSRVRGEQVDRIRRLRDDPDEVAADAVAELLYGEHPYGRLTRGRLDTVGRIDRGQVAAFHRSRFGPGGSSLVASGDLPTSFARLVEERFDTVVGPAPSAAPPATPDRPAQVGTVLIDRPGSRQSVIRIAGLGLARGDETEWPSRMMNAILGGLFNSRLNLNLREEKGWTYGARSALHLRRSPGPILLRSSVQSDVTAAAVAEMRRELQRMRLEPPSRTELDTAAGALTRSLPLRFETSSHVAEGLVEQVVYGLADDYWTRFPSSIEAVTAEDVLQVAERYLDPDRLVTLVVGDADEVAPALERLGPLEVRGLP